LTRLLARFKGFMLKLSQILATKSDYLPEAYPRHLSKVFNDMPQSSFSQVGCTIVAPQVRLGLGLGVCVWVWVFFWLSGYLGIRVSGCLGPSV
jgi:hypothetical protein